MNKCKLAIALVTLTSLAGCAGLLQPKYERPALVAGAELTNPNPQGPTVDWLQWWKSFNDPVLDGLLQEAANQSQDLNLAAGRIAEARAVLSQTEAERWPSVDLNGSATRQRTSQNGVIPSPIQVYTQRQLSLNVSFELDFWGRYANASAADRARLLAQTASRGTVLTTLYANVAQNYFNLRALDAQATLAQTILAAYQENLRLQNLRFDQGMISALDLNLVKTEVANAKVTLQSTRQSKRNTELVLATLLGRSPQEIERAIVQRGATLDQLYTAQMVPSNLPSDLLNRRPDIIASEQNLIAANADIGQARTAYFPSISLTGALGQQTTTMGTLFDPASRFWNVIAGLTQPIFRAGAIGAVVAGANARQQQAAAQYVQSVQNAFRDVHTALNNVESNRNIAQTNVERTQALRNSSRLADLQFQNGYISQLNLLLVQRDAAQAEIALLDSQRMELNSLVDLYKALGGGWDAAELAGGSTVALPPKKERL